MSSLLEAVRPLSFGAALGAGALGLMYAVGLSEWMTAIEFEQALMMGVFLGLAAGRILSRITDALFSPLARRIRHYTAVAELHFQVRHGLISPEAASEILKELTQTYFRNLVR